MADPSDPPTADLSARVGSFIDVLTRFASGDWEARAERDGSGEPMDVLAFMINATVEEIGDLMAQQRRQREELERTQAQLVHAGKLAALGELAGGVAHELNQPLTVLTGLLGLAQCDPDALDDGDLKLMAAATEAMSRIVDGVRLFARRSEMRRADFDPILPMRSAVALVARRVAADGHSLEVVEPDPGGSIVGDQDRMQQVIVNLLVNAADALESKGVEGGRIVVEGRWVEEGFEYCVDDDGVGIAPEDRERIFEPFFTTKEVGKGTGLGLSVSYGIIEDHGGRMTLECKDGPGSRFRVTVPRDGLPKDLDPEGPP